MTFPARSTSCNKLADRSDYFIAYYYNRRRSLMGMGAPVNGLDLWARLSTGAGIVDPTSEEGARRRMQVGQAGMIDSHDTLYCDV